MKIQYILFCLVWLWLSLLLFSVPELLAEGQQIRPSIGSVPFTAKSIDAMAFTEYLASALLNELEKHAGFEIAERKRLESMMEIEGVRSDSITNDQMLQLGKRVGIDFLIKASVSSQPQGMLLDLMVLSIRGQKAVFDEKIPVLESNTARSMQELAVRIRDASNGKNLPAIVTSSVSNAPLSPPEGIEASGSSSSVRLRWKHSSPERVTGYMVLRSSSPEGPFNTLSTVTDTTFVDEQLRLNETYYYRVTAAGNGGVFSQPSQVVKGATSVAPAAPIFMNTEPLLGGAVLTWRQRPCNASSDERLTPVGVRIYRKAPSEADFSPVGKLAEESASHSFREQGLVDGSAYVYKMTAYNRFGAESEFSVQLSVAIPPSTGGLSAASGKVRRVPLSWQAHPFEGVTGYRILRSTSRDGGYVELASLSGRLQTAYVDRNLSDNTTYWYKLVATSVDNGNTGASSPVSAVTRQVPPAPINVSALSGEPRRVTVSWESKAVPDDELTGFIVYRGGPGEEKLSRIAEVSGEQRRFRDDSAPLKDGTTYSYVVAAINAGGANSPLSERVNATTRKLPASPQGLSAASGEARKVTIRWNKNKESDVNDYAVYRKMDDSDYRVIKKVSELQFVDTELKDGATYSYRLQALDRDGLESLLSDPVNAMTKSVPQPVTGLKLKDGGSRTVAWQKSRTSDVKRYNIYKKHFLGNLKLASTDALELRLAESGKLEIYVTAEDLDGLESEPSASIILE